MKGIVYIIFIAIFYHMICLGSFQFTTRRRRKIKTDRPIIGIIAQSTWHAPFEDRGSLYISAAYVKFLEQSGARVVPIRVDLTEDELLGVISLNKWCSSSWWSCRFVPFWLREYVKDDFQPRQGNF